MSKGYNPNSSSEFKDEEGNVVTDEEATIELTDDDAVDTEDEAVDTDNSDIEDDVVEAEDIVEEVTDVEDEEDDSTEDESETDEDDDDDSDEDVIEEVDSMEDESETDEDDDSEEDDESDEESEDDAEIDEEVDSMEDDAETDEDEADITEDESDEEVDSMEDDAETDDSDKDESETDDEVDSMEDDSDEDVVVEQTETDDEEEEATLVGLQTEDPEEVIELPVSTLEEDEDLSDQELSLTKASDNYFLFANEAPIGKLVRTKAIESVAKLFDNESLIAPAFSAALAASNHIVTAEIIKSFGLESLVVKTTISKVLAQQINKKADVAITAAEAKALDHNEDFFQAFSIASVGINKNFWKDKINPVKTLLIETLSSVGVANAASMVQSAFEKEGDNYARTLIEKAKELVSKDTDFRNEMSIAIEEAAYQSVCPSEATAKLRAAVINPVESRSHSIEPTVEQIVEASVADIQHEEVSEDIIPGKQLFG